MSADMMLSAFDIKFHGKNDRMTPEACIPQKTQKEQKLKNRTGPVFKKKDPDWTAPNTENGICSWTKPDRPGPEHPWPLREPRMTRPMVPYKLTPLL